MSELAPVCAGCPHANKATRRPEFRLSIAHIDGVVLTPEEWAQAVASIALRRMGKDQIDLLRNKSRNYGISFIRQSVWAHLRFGMALEVSFLRMSRIVKRDHTTIISGLRALSDRIRTDAKSSRDFDAICRDVKAEYPSVARVRVYLENYARPR